MMICILLTDFGHQLHNSGHYASRGTSISRFSTSAELEKPIIPPVTVDYTKLLIDGQFVDAASGTLFIHQIVKLECVVVIVYSSILVDKHVELTYVEPYVAQGRLFQLWIQEMDK